MAESVVGVSPDGGGPKVRTIAVSELQSDGTILTTQMQVVAVALPDGTLVDLGTGPTLVDLVRLQNAILRAMLMQLSFINSPRMIVEDLTPFYSDSPIGTLS